MFLDEPFFVVAFPGVGAALVELEDPGGDVVEEVAVVGYDNEGAGEAFEVFFEPGDGFGVEVVGGFVEEEYVGVGDEEAAEGDAAAFTSGEVGGGGFGGRCAQGFHCELDGVVE